MVTFISDWKRKIDQLRRRRITSEGNKNKSKNKKEMTPQQGVAIIGSIIIILVSFGGLVLVF